jgi:hypothetical protein
MIRSSSRKLILSGLAAVLLTSIGSLPLPAQTATSKVATVISDAQAQSLMQILAAQQSGAAATALTPAQNQLLMQYLLSKNGTSAASTALGAAQTQMLMQNAATQGIATQARGISAAKALPGAPPAVTMPTATAAAATPAAATSGDKKPGIVRIGIAMPKAQLGQGQQGPSAGEPLRVMLTQYLAGPSVETIAIVALLPDQMEAEAKSKQCDFLVYSSLTQKKPAGGMGFLKNASSLSNMIPMVGMVNSVGAMAAASAATTAAQAATLSSGVKAKSDVVLEYHMTAAGNPAPVLNTTLDAKATTDGEDVITPLVEKEATAIMAEVSKKK